VKEVTSSDVLKNVALTLVMSLVDVDANRGQEVKEEEQSD
jgi:hypothetical protein